MAKELFSGVIDLVEERLGEDQLQKIRPVNLDTLKKINPAL